MRYADGRPTKRLKWTKVDRSKPKMNRFNSSLFAIATIAVATEIKEIHSSVIAFWPGFRRFYRKMFPNWPRNFLMIDRFDHSGLNSVFGAAVNVLVLN